MSFHRRLPDDGMSGPAGRFVRHAQRRLSVLIAVFIVFQRFFLCTFVVVNRAEPAEGVVLVVMW